MIYDELRELLTEELVIKNSPIPQHTHVVVGGMGGSALPANAVRFLDPTISIETHRDYDLPEKLKTDTLYIALSHSGNTEETLSFAKAVLEKNLPLAVITSGGALLELAEKHNLPYVCVSSNWQPRNALFMQTRALLMCLERDDLLQELSNVQFDASLAEEEALKLTEVLADALPVFYSTRLNGFLAYVAKIQCNETAKMPAYANIFPELNHNEMQSFDSTAPESVASLARFVLIRSATDDTRVTRRMDVFEELMKERGRSVTNFSLSGKSRAEILVRVAYIFHRTTVALATVRDVDPKTVPLVEDFKKRL